MAMDRFELQKLRDLPIEGVAGRLGIRVERHKSLCPFHDDHHASLSFHLKSNTCRCFACMTESVGTIDLVMRLLHKDFREACRWLADENNIVLTRGQPEGDEARMGRTDTGAMPKARKPFDAARYARYFEHPRLSDAARRFLFGERRLDPRVVSWCRLSSWRDKDGTDWLQTPYYDPEGRLIGVQYRNLSPSGLPAKDDPSGKNDPSGAAKPRFRFPYGSRTGIYNLPVIRRLKPGDELWITEGCSDCWAMLSAGHKAVAIPSATLLSDKDKELLRALAGGTVTLTDGAVTSTGGTVTLTGGAVTLTDGTVTLTGGTVTLTGGAGPMHVEGLRWKMYPDRDVPGERLFLQLKEILPDLQHLQLPVDCKDYADYFVRQFKTEGI